VRGTACLDRKYSFNCYKQADPRKAWFWFGSTQKWVADVLEWCEFQATEGEHDSPEGLVEADGGQKRSRSTEVESGRHLKPFLTW